jgi:hypothetical protein
MTIVGTLRTSKLIAYANSSICDDRQQQHGRQDPRVAEEVPELLADDRQDPVQAVHPVSWAR